MLLSAKTRADLGWDDLLQELARRTQTARGSEIARSITPVDNDAAQKRQREISETRALCDTGRPLPLHGVVEIGEALARVQKGGTLDPTSLCAIAATLRVGAQVRRHLLQGDKGALRFPLLGGRALLLDELEEVWQSISRSFIDGESGMRLHDHASPALGTLRKRAIAVRADLDRRVSKLLESAAYAPHLQDHFVTQRDDRYVLPIRVDAGRKVRGIVHGLSQSGHTVFVEPEEIVDLNNQLKLAEVEVAEEEHRILAELTMRVAEQLPQILANVEILTELDFLQAAAELSVALRAAPPELGGTKFDLRRARHPLLALHLDCVPSDIVVAGGQALVISGPNAGGKTVALKTLGLLTLMAHTGLHIPAQEGSRVAAVNAIFSDVGDDQSLEKNLSTFSAHIGHVREFLEAAEPNVLVLIDEIAVGTAPEEGAALAQAVLERLTERGATVLVTTHYDRLKAIAPVDARFLNASVGFDLERMTPTFELHLGIPGTSGALALARRLGFDGTLCARAAALGDGGQASVEALLQELALEGRQLQSERAELAEERTRASAATRRAEEYAERTKQALQEARRQAHDEAIETLQAARKELDLTRSVLRRSRQQSGIAPDQLAEAKREVERAAEKVHASSPPATVPSGRSAGLADLTVGREVFVARLGGRAKVLSAAKSGKITVQAGPLRVAVSIEEVFLDDNKPVQSARTKRGHNAFDLAAPPPPLMQKGRPTLDLRGERSDVAIGLAEKFVDDALRSGDSEIWLVHGHGTLALRNTLRAHFRNFPGLESLRPGQPEEGGDGVTILKLG